MADRVVVPSLRHPRRQVGEAVSIRQALGQVWGAGGPVDWAAVHGGRVRRVPLPTYPFDHERYWIDPVRAGGRRGRPGGPCGGARAQPHGYDRHAGSVCGSAPRRARDHVRGPCACVRRARDPQGPGRRAAGLDPERPERHRRVLPRRNGELRGARVRLAVPHAGECPVPEAVRRADHLPPAVRGGAVHRYAGGVHRLEACARRAARAGTGGAGGRGRPGRRGGSGRDPGPGPGLRLDGRMAHPGAAADHGAAARAGAVGRAAGRHGLPPARAPSVRRRSERRAQAVDTGAREDPLPRDRRPGPSPGWPEPRHDRAPTGRHRRPRPPLQRPDPGVEAARPAVAAAARRQPRDRRVRQGLEGARLPDRLRALERLADLGRRRQRVHRHRQRVRHQSVRAFPGLRRGGRQASSSTAASRSASRATCWAGRRDGMRDDRATTGSPSRRPAARRWRPRSGSRGP